MSILDLVQPKDLARVASLKIFAREIVEGFQSGRHRSPHKGFSVDFKEHRPYVRGDELRNIDWKVFGKSDKLFIRQFEEETNLRCHLMVDISGSMAYAGERADGITKGEYATRLAACLAYLMLSQQDAVGLVTFDNQPRKHVPTLSRPSHLQAILEALSVPSRNLETDLGETFRRSARKIRQRSLVILLSDAMGEVDSLNRAFAQLRAAKNDVIFFHVLDPDELDFPFTGRVLFRSLERESDQRLVESSSIRNRYLDRLASHRQSLKEICRRHRVDLVTLQTDQPYADALAQYVTMRRRIR